MKVFGVTNRDQIGKEGDRKTKDLGGSCQERGIKPRRLDNPRRLALVWLSRRFDWRSALTIVTPKTFIGWHRRGFQLYWHRKMPIRPAADSARPPEADPHDRSRESRVGQGANRK
jgi:hypothetical protein